MPPARAASAISGCQHHPSARQGGGVSAAAGHTLSTATRRWFLKMNATI